LDRGAKIFSPPPPTKKVDKSITRSIPQLLNMYFKTTAVSGFIYENMTECYETIL
jgi:hypothetical protein